MIPGIVADSQVRGVAAQTYTYYKLNITANNGAGAALNVAEFELRETIGGSDVTSTQGSFDADSFNTGNEPSKAFDDSTSTWWRPTAGNTTGFLVVNFAAGGLTIKEYGVQWKNTTAILAAPKDWTFEASTNGADWIVLHTIVGMTSWTINELKLFTTGL